MNKKDIALAAAGVAVVGLAYVVARPHLKAEKHKIIFPRKMLKDLHDMVASFEERTKEWVSAHERLDTWIDEFHHLKKSVDDLRIAYASHLDVKHVEEKVSQPLHARLYAIESKVEKLEKKIKVDLSSARERTKFWVEKYKDERVE